MTIKLFDRQTSWQTIAHFNATQHDFFTNLN